MLADSDRETLLDIAQTSIRHGLETGRPLEVDITRYSEALRQSLACFVTLHIEGALRGCIGSLEAHRPLVEDVAENAFHAAFRDPRFPPLAQTELPRLDVAISVLSSAQALEFSSEDDLIRQLRPGIDGLVLEEGSRRGTFLPSVWESLRDPTQFLQHLKNKAGLPMDYWSAQIKVARYTTESFARSATG